MRRYVSTNKKLVIICNRCGKVIKTKKDVALEGVFGTRYNWNYYSKKDTEIHLFDLCESCYDEMVKNFIIPVDVEKSTELM